MNSFNIEILSQEDRRNLIDYVEGLPTKLNSLIKLSLSKDYMNPTMYVGRDRKLSEYSTIQKYLGKEYNINQVSNPLLSDYQSEFSSINYDLDNMKLPASIKNSLSSIIMSESYDGSTMAKCEVALTDVIKSYKSIPYIKREQLCELIDFINFRLIPYKCKVYDLYTIIVLKNEGFDVVDSTNYNHLTNIISCINSLLECDDISCLELSNIANFIYMYFKEIGMETCIDKYDLMTRFEYALSENMSDSMIQDIKSKIYELSIRNEKIGNCISSIIDVNDRFDSIDSDIEDSNATGSRSFICNGYTFFGKNINELILNADDTVIQINRLNKNLICEYLDDTEPESIMFYLSENDLGHIQDTKNMQLITVYSESTKDMKYLVSYQDENYLLFKIKSHPSDVMGISLRETNENRKIMNFKESKNFFFKFVNNI